MIWINCVTVFTNAMTSCLRFFTPIDLCTIMAAETWNCNRNYSAILATLQITLYAAIMVQRSIGVKKRKQDVIAFVNTVTQFIHRGSYAHIVTVVRKFSWISLEVGTTTCILLWLNIHTISHYFQDLRDTLHVVINYFHNQQIHVKLLSMSSILDFRGLYFCAA
jgi:hypothetical protein